MLSHPRFRLHPALLALIFTTFTAPAVARILRVPQQYNRIQVAVDSSANGDTILVAPGRYTENINFNNRSPVLASQFLTTGEARFIAETVIDGGWNGRSAIRLGNGESGAIIGLTVENDSTDFGAIYIRLGRPDIRHCVIQNNYASRNGAAIYITGAAAPRISNVIIRHNECFNVGGAVSIFGGSTPLIENSLIYDNYALHVGGAIHVYASRAILRGVTIAHNAALHFGGAIYVTQGGIVDAADCILWENEPEQVWMMVGWQDQVFHLFFNLIDGGRDRIVALDPWNVNWGVGNLDADPLFTNPAEGDYSLRAGSPAIDAGHYESAFDPDGTRRDLGYAFFDQGDEGQRVRIVPTAHQTIQEGIDAADDGDVVLVLPGTYRENVRIEDKRIALGSRILTTGNRAYIDSTVIDGARRAEGVSIRGRGTAGTIASGFTIQNGSGAIGGGVYCHDGASPILEDVKIRNCDAQLRGGGLGLTGRSRATLRRVELRVNRAGQMGGGASGELGTEMVIEECKFIGNTTEGIGGGLAAPGADITLRNTVFANNEAGDRGGGDGGGAIHIWAGSGQMELTNLTLHGNSHDGGNAGGIVVRTQGEVLAVAIRNCILTGNDGLEVTNIRDEGGRIADVTISYSLVESAEEGVGGEGITYHDSNFDADPQFVDAGNGDFHLTAESPCIDRGDPDSPRDADGTRADVGAYYFHQVIEREARRIDVPDEYRTIQSAIDAAMIGDTVLVAPGTYYENLDYRGKLILVASRYLLSGDVRDIGRTVIDGRREDGVPAPTVQFVRNESADAHLYGFTVTGGSAREGGGLFFFRTSPTVSYCVVTGNHGLYGGGGLYAYGSWPTLDHLTITGNTADAGGGGTHQRNGSWMRMMHTIVRDNEGAEIYIHGDRDPCTVEVDWCNIEGGEEGIADNDNANLEWGEGNIDADPRFLRLTGSGDYRLAAGSPCIDAGNPDAAAEPDESAPDIGALYYDQRVWSEGDFSVAMRRGWTMIGAPLLPDPRAMTEIWRLLVEAGRLIIVKDHRGRFYHPEIGFNNLPDWDPRQGYLVKTTDFSQLNLAGTIVDPAEPIPLREGWSMVSYLPFEETDVMTAFNGVLDDLIIVKDGFGRFYLPAMEFSNMVAIEPGRGYQVKMARTRELVWNGWQGMQNAEPGMRRNVAAITGGSPIHQGEEEGEPIHFQPVKQSGMNMSVLIDGRWKMEYGAGEIGVFTTDGLCVGAASFRTPHSAFRIGFAVWGDDPTTVEVDGAREGEELRFHLWDGQNESMLNLHFALEHSSTRALEHLSYQTDAIAVGTPGESSALPAAFALHPPYPNPFNGVVIIRYDLPSAADVRLAVFDLAGREVARLAHGRQPARRHSIVWEGANVASGIYIVRLKAGAIKRSAKLHLIR
ncbi:MAG: T9SS type A sorting domain-containing protein [Calditrichaeota bacterium]|nr:T9SS type A sorting domain-containing protein [Calditrichota bacterium]